jgi:hypothetical protein
VRRQPVAKVRACSMLHMSASHHTSSTATASGADGCDCGCSGSTRQRPVAALDTEVVGARPVILLLQNAAYSVPWPSDGFVIP